MTAATTMTTTPIAAVMRRDTPARDSSTAGRLGPYSGRTRGSVAMPPPGYGRSVPDGEHRFEVVLGEDLEGDHRLRPHDALERDERLGDDLGQVLVTLDLHERDEVPVAGHRVGLADALQVREDPAERRHRIALGLDEDDGRRHGVKVSPG